ncbi:DoxX family protein [Nitriliruptor alkaliphilus]|uniref:DoxX family protein n=1 Tax=Nitriliruptor alkaliphilus TaxID=427918 RepID=UPI0006968229|nr:DoxX family protein [Nitriliruptor alkaliphilus]
MHLLGLPQLRPLAPAAPIIARVLVGVVMAAHGWQKLTEITPAGFGGGMLDGMGVPAPVLVGWIVTLIELVGGVLLVVGGWSRIAALLNAGVLVGAFLLVKIDVGLLAPMGADMPGAELEFALLAGLLVVALLGPGKPSLDHVLGIERGTPTTSDRELTRV